LFVVNAMYVRRGRRVDIKFVNGMVLTTYFSIAGWEIGIGIGCRQHFLQTRESWPYFFLRLHFFTHSIIK